MMWPNLLIAERDAARAELAQARDALEARQTAAPDLLAELRRERDELAARLEAIERAEPVAWIERITGRLADPTDEHRTRFPMVYSPLIPRPAPSAAPDLAGIVAAERERWKRIAENAQAVTTGGDDKGDYFEVPSHLIAALALALDEGLGAQGQAGAEAANPAGGCGARR